MNQSYVQFTHKKPLVSSYYLKPYAAGACVLTEHFLVVTLSMGNMIFLYLFSCIAINLRLAQFIDKLH